MRSVAAHLEECLELAQSLERFDAELSDAMGCVLAEPVRSTIDVPLADIAACDGYAVRAEDVSRADDARASEPTNPTRLRVTDEIFADSVESFPHVEGTAIRIASGARMPRGADAVVPLWSTDQGAANVTIHQGVCAGENVRRRGEDVVAGDVIVEAGTRLSARHIALLASAGWGGVVVHPAPRVVVMSIGNELVAPGRAVPPGKVYDANSHALAAAVTSAGAVPYRVPAVPDTRSILREAIEDQALRADVLITTGGLSYGGGDTLKDVLLPLGSVRFDNVAMNPGHQIGAGKLEDGTLIFCLPGDPVSALVAFEVFVRTSLCKMAGYVDLGPETVTAVASGEFLSDDGVRDFVRVALSPDGERGFTCAPVPRGDKNLLSGLVSADGLAIIPEGVTTVAPGDELECLVFQA
ncbi:MAG: molybdopterin molybdotransferase MoeA [Ancrocorticia sp.]